MKTNWRCLVIGLGFALACAPLLRGQTEGLATDQVNNYYHYNNNNTLQPWQSFTAGEDGFLAAVQVHIFATSADNWSAVLEIREGEGTAGRLLTSQTVTGDGVSQQRTFVLETPVRQNSGSVYTFIFNNVSEGLTVRISNDTYAGGRSHRSENDLNFKTWVIASYWSDEEWRDTTFTVGPNPRYNYISTAAQLAQLVWLTKNNMIDTDDAFYLTADIDLGAHYWDAIGDWSNPFKGRLCGNGYTIRNLFIHRPDSDHQGLFRYNLLGSSVEKLIITNVDIVAANYVGGVAGFTYGSISDCQVYGRVTGIQSVGGVVGSIKGPLNSCTNYAEVNGYSECGGVAGCSFSVVQHCVNRGTVTSNGGTAIGGVVGRAWPNSWSPRHLNTCVNYGDVSGHERVGGVVGQTSAIMTKCSNRGTISGNEDIGGVVGYAEGKATECSNSGAVSGIHRVGGVMGKNIGVMAECSNSGAISGSEDIGGVAGWSDKDVEQCANSGTVNGAERVGGVVGYTHDNTTVVSCCANSGDVSGVNDVGGVVGYTCANANCCTNSGTVNGNERVGGVAGYTHDETTVVNFCVNSGDVSGVNDVGGMVGRSCADVNSCTNSGIISGTEMVGGMVGFSYEYTTVVDSCVNSGDVSGGDNVGGVVGYTFFKVTSCVNHGTVTGLGGINTGGVAGLCAGTLFDCRNSGSITGPKNAGGIIGRLYYGVIDRCLNSGTVSGPRAGGIVANSELVRNTGVLRNCVNSGNVNSSIGHAGGIAGLVGDNVTIMNCANSGNVSCTDSSSGTGGIAGWNYGVIANSVSSGSVSGDYSGGLVGRNRQTIMNGFWKETGTAPYNLEAVGEYSGQVINCHSFSDAPGTLAAPLTVDGTTTDSLAEALNTWMLMTRDTESLPLRRWTPGSATAYPTIIIDNWCDVGNYSTNWYSAAGTRFQIGTASELAGLAVLVNAGITFEDQLITLTDDIDLHECEWTPIGWISAAGEPVDYFAGTFDGNGKSVSGVYVDGASEWEAAGFFGAAYSMAMIANLALTDVDVAGKTYAGAMFGYLNYSWNINNSCRGRVSGAKYSGGIVGRYEALMGNCWSDVRVSGQNAGGVVGLLVEGTEITHSYWKRTGEAPFNLPAAGKMTGEALWECYAFGAAPGILELPPDILELPPEEDSATIAQAMNHLVKMVNAVDYIGEYEVALYGWSPGTATSYPVMVPLLRVGEEYAAEPFSAAFAHGTTLGEAAALVTTYTNVHANATAASLGALLSQAELLGFRLYELAQGNAILDFAPTLRVTAFDPSAAKLHFELENGIDASPMLALDRLLNASPTARLTVQQMATPGGTPTPLNTTVQVTPDHTTATYIPEIPGNSSFFKLSIIR